MSVHRSLFFCAAVLMSQLAAAGSPTDTRDQDRDRDHVGAAQIDAVRIGALQAAVDFCSKLDPKDNKRFAQQATALLGKVTQDATEIAHRSADYQRAYQALSSLLAQYPTADAEHGCAGIL